MDYAEANRLNLDETTPSVAIDLHFSDRAGESDIGIHGDIVEILVDMFLAKDEEPDR